MSIIPEVYHVRDHLAQLIVSPRAHAGGTELHNAFRWLRASNPVGRVETGGFDPFWAITKHADIVEASRQSVLFHSGDKGTMASHGGGCDFARDVAFHYPLRVVMGVLGLPAEYEAFLLKLIQEIFGVDDEDLRRDARSIGAPEEQVSQRMDTLADCRSYFEQVTNTRRSALYYDFASAIADANVDGALIQNSEATNYYVAIMSAGHETTSSPISGAIWALCERPDELRSVMADRSLVLGLVEEAVRFTSPVGHIMRMATAQISLRGRVIAKGDRLMLCYPSGNRDEEVFDDADEFRVDRGAVRHRAFRSGARTCLGQHLARVEMRIFFEELLARLEHIELAGLPRRSASIFVSGPKNVPIRYRMH
jgi:cytochrome P450